MQAGPKETLRIPSGPGQPMRSTSDEPVSGTLSQCTTFPISGIAWGAF